MRNLACFTLLTRSISTKLHHPCVTSDFDRVVADGLITAFTRERKPGYHPRSQALMPPGSKLTTQIVESVLKGIKTWRFAHDFFYWASTQNGYRHNCYTYNTMASILSNARQNAPLKALVSLMLNSRCSVTPGALGYFIRCLARAGLVQEANSLFDQVRFMGLCVPNNYTYNCLMEALSKTSLVDLAEMRLNEMRSLGWEVDKYTLTPLLKVYCSSGELNKALDVYNHMYEQGWFDVHVLSILALSYSKCGKVDEAFELIESMEDRNVKLNQKTFHVLIHGFVSASRIDRALQLFEKMKSYGFLVDMSIYDVLIGQLCKSKEFNKALSLYYEMKASGIHPDVGILAKLISSSAKEDMLQLFEDCGEYLSKKSTIFLYNVVVSDLANNGAIDRAYWLIRIATGFDRDCSDTFRKKMSMLEGAFQPNAASFRIVIDCLCKNGQLDEALDLLRHMDRFSCKKELLIYNNLIDALSISNRLTDCLELLREMKDSGLQPTQFTYNSIYGYFCRIGDEAGALHLVKEMQHYGFEPWIKHSTLLIEHLSNHGRVMEACNFLSDMVKEGARPNVIPYSAALEGLLNAREVDRALEHFQDICADGKRPDVVAYNILINGLCKAKRLLEAENALMEMLGNGLVPSVVTYNSLIDGWCKNGKIDQALKLFSEMVEEEPNVITYTTLIDGLCNTGQPDDAIKMWDEMQRKGCSPNRIAFMALINGLCKNGKPEMALNYLHQMNEKELRADSFIYVVLLGALLSKDNTPLAFNVLKEMVDKSVLLDPSDKNYSVLKDIVAKLCEDPQTSSNMQSLLVSGTIPNLHFEES